MNNRRIAPAALVQRLLALLALAPAALLAQVPVDDNGEIIGTYEEQPSTAGNEEIPLLSTTDLEELIGPIALYPDDLLAIVLPASAYPLQIIEAGRFLEALEDDPTLKPDPDWDDSVVALVNYPEVVELLNEDIDWTWRLGEAVVSQQGDVVAAIETFRDRAYAAGNLKSDSYQNVTRDEGIIEITPVTEDVIYVPYYEPERVVVYQPRPVYYYYPRAYPVYYYPYSSAHAFNDGFFWGVTTAFTIGWYSDSLNVFHHSYHGHPYYGRHYRDRWWYRRPSINVYNTTYISRRSPVTVNRYYGGDRWRPRHNRRDYVRDVRVTRSRTTRYERDGTLQRRTTVRRDNGAQQTVRVRRSDRTGNQRQTARRNDRREQRHSERREPITFRERPQTVAMNRRTESDKRRSGNSYRAETRNKREHTIRSQPTPKLRQATPRERPATVRRQEPAARTTRRSQEPRQVERPRSNNARRTEARRSDNTRRTAEPRPERRATQRQEKKTEQRREPPRQDRKSDGKRQDRTSERNTRRRR